MELIKLYTIGFTKISAERFFRKLSTSGTKKVLDVRLNNVSQLAGFTKREDLQFFLKSITGIDYRHALDLAPTQDLLDQYKKDGCSWDKYAEGFTHLMERREIEKKLAPSEVNGACLLCSEASPHHCHRRLVAEYLKSKWGNIEIHHLEGENAK